MGWVRIPCRSFLHSPFVKRQTSLTPLEMQCYLKGSYRNLSSHINQDISHSLSVSFNQVIRDYLKRCNYTVITDTGPKYLGIVVLSDDVLRGYGSFELPLHAEDPANQNSREFMGYFGGVLLLLQVVETIKHDDFTLPCQGDNTSALSWVEKNKCGSCGTQSAFMALT